MVSHLTYGNKTNVKVNPNAFEKKRHTGLYV